MTSVALALIVWNEEEGLNELLSRVPLETFDEVVAIDGGSRDGTLRRLRAARIATFVQSRPGYGAAMFDARERVQSDALVFFHPDGNESPADLSKIAALLRGGFAFVVASRVAHGGWNEDDARLLKWRKWANQGFALLANALFAHDGNRTSDVTNGLRGVQASTFDRMRLTSTDLTLDYQMVIHALKLGIPITEFPTHEGCRISGATNFASISTGIAELRLLWHEVRLGLRNVS